jgi:hypothetical protein
MRVVFAAAGAVALYILAYVIFRGLNTRELPHRPDAADGRGSIPGTVVRTERVAMRILYVVFLPLGRLEGALTSRPYLSSQW